MNKTPLKEICSKTVDKLSGIYIIENIKNGKRYVGSAKNLLDRAYGHLRTLKLNKHHNFHLQKSFNENGIDSFVFYILFYMEKNLLIEYEQKVMDHYKLSNHDFGYNICPNAGNRIGIVRRPETIKKIKESKKFTREQIEERRTRLCKDKILCIQTKEIFSSIIEIVEKMGLSRIVILRCFKTPYRTAGGYRFIKIPKEYIESNIENYISEYNHQLSIYKENNKYRSKRPKIICNETGLVYKNGYEAADKMGIRAGSVYESLNQSNLKINGYSFSYVEKFEDMDESKNYMEFICHETGDIFFSVREASRVLNLRESYIYRCLNKYRNSTSGYSFSYSDNIKVVKN